MTNQGSRQVQKQVDGKEDLDSDNTSLLLTTVLSTNNNKIEHESLCEAVRLLDAHPVCQ
jgi:hypothetical protein